MKGSIGFEINTLAILMRREANKADIEKESPKIGWVIGYLYARKNDDVFQRDIEKLSMLRRSTTTVMLQKMEQKGLIERTSVDSDARLKKVTLTPKAIAMHQQVLEQIKKTDEMLTAGISQEELAAFIKTADKMKKNLLERKATEKKQK